MREDAAASDFASNLLKLGDGALEVLPTGNISIPDTIGNIIDSRDGLLNTIYPDIGMKFNDISWLRERERKREREREGERERESYSRTTQRYCR